MLEGQDGGQVFSKFELFAHVEVRFLAEKDVVVQHSSCCLSFWRRRHHPGAEKGIFLRCRLGYMGYPLVLLEFLTVGAAVPM